MAAEKCDVESVSWRVSCGLLWSWRAEGIGMLRLARAAYLVQCGLERRDLRTWG